jgi:hypothetical protein
MFAIHADSHVELLSANDAQSLKSIRHKKLVILSVKYSLFFVLLLVLLYSAQSGTIRIRSVSPEDIRLMLSVFVCFFVISLVGFLINDYIAGMRPFEKELKQAKKLCYTFPAQKYYDPIYKHYLLFYPDKEDVYINVDKECFDQIENGAELHMEVTPVTGSILLLQSDRLKICKASEYRFR